MAITVIDDGGLGLIEALLIQYNNLQSDFTGLVAIFNAHVHQTPGATYAQNANTTAPTTTDVSVESNQISLLR